MISLKNQTLTLMCLVVGLLVAATPNVTAQEVPAEAQPVVDAAMPVAEHAWWTVWTTWLPVVGQLDNPTDDGFKECNRVAGINACVAVDHAECYLWVSALAGGCWMATPPI